jgi:hypothetical protein
MAGFEHPFTNAYRAVLKEKHPDKALSDDSPIDPRGMPEGVTAEAMRRCSADKELVIHTPFQVKPVNTAPKPKIKRTVAYA